MKSNIPNIGKNKYLMLKARQILCFRKVGKINLENMNNTYL
jgi:hypothetical protein